ncbi:MAG: pseudouridine synthase [Patescibacteria group bacterium]|mgnify:CR=1 FL=1
MQVRINKYLADCGIASRRAIDKLIVEGRIAINGVVLKKPGAQVEQGDRVTMNGKRIDRAPSNHTYILFNKPANCITTASDPQGRKTVLDYVRLPARMFPIGRLDRDTTGVLILTNDGDLANKLMHPRYSVEKQYQVHLNKPLTETHRKTFESGIMLEGRKTAPCTARFAGNKRNVVITLHEGRNRQIHRMFKELGYRVEQLERTRYAGLMAKGLGRGEWRELTKKEIEQITNSIL